MPETVDGTVILMYSPVPAPAVSVPPGLFVTRPLPEVGADPLGAPVQLEFVCFVHEAVKSSTALGE